MVSQEGAGFKDMEGQASTQTYRNPILPGDHPDPSLIRVGDEFYLTCSTFISYPGLVIYRSRDLLSWSPICAALHLNIGSVFAPDLVYHEGQFYIYFAALGDSGMINYVIKAGSIEGPWSQPVDLGIEGFIDPGHAVGEDGRRYLFLNGVYRVPISDDGLSALGKAEFVCHPWKYPDDWVVEMYAPEGPKILRRAEYFYMISAVGGTAGPPTSHMVVVSRSRSIHGPWEECPNNPIIRTWSAEEAWWSRGHATFIEDLDGSWWAVYHGYEKGFWTLGRQTLLEPIQWKDDGWPEAGGGDLSRALPAPKAVSRMDSPAGPLLSDDFSISRLGTQWRFHQTEPIDQTRLEFSPTGLLMKGKGNSLAGSSPLCMVAQDRSYEVEVDAEIFQDAQAGLILFYSERAYCGIGVSPLHLHTYGYGEEHPWMRVPAESPGFSLRLRNLEHVVTLWYRYKDGEWIQHPWQMEVSGLHHNVFGGFTSLKIGLFVSGEGEARFRRFRYQARTKE